MNIQITAKKIEIPPEIRDYAKEKFSKLEKFNPNIQSIEAVIRAEERSVVCETVIRLEKHDSIVIEVEGETIQAAVDIAESKAERQLRKSKERDSVRRRAKLEDREMP
jgi:putative sigma-54 modulation protein